MNKTVITYTHTKKNGLAGPKNPREKYEVPRYKGLQDKRRDIVNFKRKNEDANTNMTFKPKINPRKDVAKSMNFHQG